MSYNIAIASSDGIHINEHFGSAQSFYIVTVEDDGTFRNIGNKQVIPSKNINDGNDFVPAARCSKSSGNSCGSGCGQGHSESNVNNRIEVITDCRCVLCKQCGQGAEKQLAKKLITVFQIEMEIEKALEKVIQYYYKIDNHQTLRK